jgi:acetyl-CoA synthetase
VAPNSTDKGALFVYDYERFHADEALGQLAKARVTSIMAQPTVYRQMLNAGMDHYDLSSVRCFAVGGEKLTRDVSEEVYRQTGHHLLEGYAQSEAGLIAANSKNMGRKQGSVGKILPKYHVEILKDDGSIAAAGEHGEIVLVADGGKRPVGLLMGYFEDKEADAMLWDGNLFHTNDAGYKDEDGFLFYLGRSDGLIKTRGYRVSPFEIENAVSRHPAVYECLAVGVEDAAFGQRIKVFVHLMEGYVPSEELKKELLSFHNDVCTGFKKIQEMEFVSGFCRNSNGKIIRDQFVL